MKYWELGEFFGFEACVGHLADIRKGHEVVGDESVGHHMTQFFEYLDSLGLLVTKRVATGELVDVLKNLTKYDDDSGLEEKDAQAIREALGIIRPASEAALSRVRVYKPTSKRIDLQKLLGNTGGLFAPNVFEKLPKIARSDFEKVGKCIAFELPTAAVFHILRATENILRHYYKGMIRQKRIAPLDWGPMVEDLRVRLLTKKHDILNDRLDNIRKSFRNPSEYSNAVYNIHEVESLWSLCVDINNRMIQTLRQNDKLGD